MVGNKVDLVDDEQVNYDEALAYAKDLNAIFQLTSAKDNKGIDVNSFILIYFLLYILYKNY